MMTIQTNVSFVFEGQISTCIM